ncbi:hypothetical protein GCM10009827_041040 [Dactylosporangium maewongense]|uniref:Uncharacterized protein n=1 Tax=Dactylosporangium maewongense TaxID=634393 RepID=A0ABN2AK17_9ACTN
MRDEKVGELGQGAPPVAFEIRGGAVAQGAEQRLEAHVIGDDHIDDISHPPIVPHIRRKAYRRLEC